MPTCFTFTPVALMKYYLSKISKVAMVTARHSPFLYVNTLPSMCTRIWHFDILRRVERNSCETRKRNSSGIRQFSITCVFSTFARTDEEDIDVEKEYEDMYGFRISQPDPAIDTSRVEEIPAKEPKFHAVPLKSVLKKRGSGSGPGTPQNTPTQENRPLTLRQELHASFKLVPPRVPTRTTHRCPSISVDGREASVGENRLVDSCEGTFSTSCRSFRPVSRVTSVVIDLTRR